MRGSTLIELLVTLVVIGVALGVATVVFRPDPEPTAGERRERAIADARHRAITARRVVTFALSADSMQAEGVAYPDGRVLLTDTGVVEPMSGRLRAE